jgi:hypothetical protein
VTSQVVKSGSDQIPANRFKAKDFGRMPDLHGIKAKKRKMKREAPSRSLKGKTSESHRSRDDEASEG